MDWEKTIIDSLEWGKEISNREEKQKVADKIASMVKDGDIIGVGSGSTAYLALLKIADRIRTEQLHIHAIPTSQEIKMACAKLGIPLTSLLEHKPNWTFDGADEIDPNHNMIKGRGGAMFKEKLLIGSSPQTFIIADPSKMVSKLGSRFPVPVEIFPDALIHADQALRSLSPVDIKLRMAQGKDGPIITENGNLILDVWFNNIPDNLENAIKSITGVIESGLFMHYEVKIIS
ncbi:ribose 5-phosphate isomerase A [Parabacteroides sp. AM58-2XD]|uniref:ribose 5-phosphate isomerase A n=1 Tax=Parabacteroides TaxID=375288 RepID=UPI000FE2481E|nr:MULTISPECIES: ribose 5-phosphate isomerase A [Parabacteroides]RGY99521.1 ribose 5-phosphate isomerase A [Parabacteroides sp. AM58-2XD]GKG70925.1 ribose-5-phosphate isomerase [Parabacteroides goldsteinii]GKG76876.1 ribose-5-phosphate isomerase [Parabacteroides goldsteinii]